MNVESPPINAIIPIGRSGLVYIMIEQILVEPSLDLPLSQDDLLDICSDEDDLHDDIYIIPMQSLKNDHAICVLKSSTCAENRLVIHNASCSTWF